MIGQQVTIGGRFHILDRTRGDDLAQDLMDRGLIACTATDAHDATKQVPCGNWNEWGTSLLAVMVGEET